MGELSGLQSSPVAPPWAFYAPVDLSQWRWEPPQHPSVLKRQQDHSREKDVGGLSAVLPRWLGKLVTDNSYEQPTRLHDLDPPVFTVKLFDTNLHDFRDSVAQSPLDVLITDTENLCQSLRQSIILGEHPVKVYKRMCLDILAALDSRFGFDYPPPANNLYLSISSAIVTGLGSSSVLHPVMFNTSFWDQLLARVSLLPLADVSRLYSEVLDVFPRGKTLNRWTRCILGRLLSSRTPSKSVVDTFEESSLVELLQTQYVSNPVLSAPGGGLLGMSPTLAQNIHHARTELQNAPVSLASTDTVASASTRYGEIMSRALATIESDKLGHDLVFQANSLVQKRLLVDGTGRYELRHAWLSVLAHMPTVREKLLLQTFAFMSSNSLGIKPLTEPELCSLMITQWASRGYLDSPAKVKQSYEAYRSGREDTAISSLALAMFYELGHSPASTWIRRGLYGSLWRMLASLGRSDDMVKSLRALSYTLALPRGFLFALCSPCGDHRVMLRVASLYMHDLRQPGGPDWNPALVKKHAKRIIFDRSLPPAIIWSALGIDRLGQRLGEELAEHRWRHLGSYGRHRAQIAKQIATSLAETPHLRPRVAFRHVSQCMRFMEMTTRGVPLPVIKALYRVVTRSTSREEMGIAARQKWFVDVVRRHHGDHAADECCRALDEWREGMRRVWIRRTKARYG